MKNELKALTMKIDFLKIVFWWAVKILMNNQFFKNTF